MNYKEYKHWLEVQPSTSWMLGELDVFTTLGELSKESHSVNTTAVEVLNLWRKKMGWNSGDKSLVVTKGVRDGLQKLNAVLQILVEKTWIPNDVYPVYASLLDRCEHYEQVDVSWLDVLERSGKKDALLLSAPVHPSGRYLGKQEVTALINWLDESKGRWVIVDAAYDYEGISLEHDRCIILRTMSKAWLCRAMYGVIEVRTDVAKKLTDSSISAEILSHCLGTLRGSYLPNVQQSLFSKAWQRIEAQVEERGIEFTSPETGYLARIDNNLLEIRDDIVVVPSTVFGVEKNMSVVSCLSEINYE